MIRFPVIKSLTVEKFGLYPHSYETPFKVDFHPGPNVIVGVNGSGKTTLITAALRCLTGPYDLPSSTSEGELGQVRPKPVSMSRYERQMFARRVADGAHSATATLLISAGDNNIEVKRSLANLGLLSILLNGRPVELPTQVGDKLEDAGYHSFLCKNVGVGTFFDILIILRFLVFMLEDRRALVWDSTAQRQIYRVLLLPPERAAEFAEAQQEVISADSAVRNTQHLIYRQENEKTKAAKRAVTVAEAEAERRVKSAQADALREHLERVSQERLEAEGARQAARLARLKASEAREAASRELERIKLEALGHWLTPDKNTARYVIGHLLSDKLCLVCGTNPSPLAEAIDNRFREGKCPICGAKHAMDEHVKHISEGDKLRIIHLEGAVGKADQQIATAEEQLSEAMGRLRAAENDFDALEKQRFALDREIVALLKKIPTERAAIASAESDIDALRRILVNERRRRDTAETRFRKVVGEAVAKVQDVQDRVANAFSKYLQMFIKEEAGLIYQTVEAKVGQGGAKFSFPAFRLAMSGGAISGQTVREQPDAVSQSQAEFVDLAFRMALMSVASDDGAASLVVDAPEASLDFLFAERAGQQLLAFSRASADNRVIITSYLPSKHLVGAFLADTKGAVNRRSRIIDLISNAAENAAIRSDKARYLDFLEQIIQSR